MKNIIFFLIFVPATAWSENDCGQARPTVYFANGMFNSRKAATKSAQLLGKFLQENKHKYDVVNSNDVHLSYNTNEFAWLELLQVIEQKFASELDHFFFNASVISAAPSFIQKTISAIEEKYTSLITATDSDLFIQIQEYSQALNSTPILVVAHSQGNFYSNLAYASLKNEVADIEGKFLIHSIATPNSFVAGQGTYTTLTSDGIIKMVPGSLAANVSNSNSGFFDHEFAKHYLNGDKSGPRISEQIRFLSGKIDMKFPIKEHCRPA